jgi:hypothetical protein
MGLLPEPIWEERLVARTTPPGRLPPAARGLLGCLRAFLTPAVWRQAHRAVRSELRQVVAQRRRRPFTEGLAAARREERARRSVQERRVWPQRTPHQPPKPRRLLTMTDAEKARIPSLEADAA